MSTFDQRGQKVSGNQYNTAGDLNIAHQANKADIPSTLRSLTRELDKLVREGAIPRATAIDIEANLKKAILFSEEQKPNKTAVLSALEVAKKLTSSVSSAAGFVASVTKAIQSVNALL